MPRLMPPDQKLIRLVLSQANLSIFEADLLSFLDRSLTQAGYWVHYFEPETKRQSMHPGSTPLKKAKSRLLSREGDAISFMGCKGHCVRSLTSQRQNY